MHDTDINDVVDTFLQMIKLGLETIGPNINIALKVLATINYHSNELVDFFSNNRALDILKDKAQY